jgi:hypothetical protein
MEFGGEAAVLEYDAKLPAQNVVQATVMEMQIVTSHNTTWCHKPSNLTWTL